MYATWTLIDGELLDGSPENKIKELGGTCEIIYSTVISDVVYVLAIVSGENFESNIGTNLDPWSFTLVSAETAYSFIDSTFFETFYNPRAIPGIVEPTKAEMLSLIQDWPI